MADLQSLFVTELSLIPAVRGKSAFSNRVTLGLSTTPGQCVSVLASILRDQVHTHHKLVKKATGKGEARSRPEKSLTITTTGQNWDPNTWEGNTWDSYKGSKNTLHNNLAFHVSTDETTKTIKPCIQNCKLRVNK